MIYYISDKHDSTYGVLGSVSNASFEDNIILIPGAAGANYYGFDTPKLKHRIPERELGNVACKTSISGGSTSGQGRIIGPHSYAGRLLSFATQITPLLCIY